jgi:hypothetical protein|uniref:Uncharacterized protein n=1 Tax=Podoviridae sp. ctz6O13 TaxID=2827757 RepID=A0A8S5TKZ8_9CAUD|nr:MAG TPA: hypothetical protein [Podoviridae sp. ctz6O13]
MENILVRYIYNGVYYVPYEGKLRLADVKIKRLTLCNGKVTYQVTFHDNKEKVILDDIKAYQYPQDFKIGKDECEEDDLYTLVKAYLYDTPVFAELDVDENDIAFYTYKEEDGFPVRHKVHPFFLIFPNDSNGNPLDIDTTGCYASTYDFYLWNDLTATDADKEVVYTGLLKKGSLDKTQQRLVSSFKRLVDKMKQAGITTVYNSNYDSFSFLNGSQLSFSVNNRADEEVLKISYSDMKKLLRLNYMPSFADVELDSNVDHLCLEC